MSRTTILLSAPLGLGALLLLWAAVSSRGDQPSKPARPERKTATAKPAPPTADAPLPVRASPPSASYVAPGGGGEYGVIEERIRLMEAKLVALEAKRDELAGANQELERQINEKNADAMARAQAEGRVRSWEFPLGLSETQKQALLELWTQWHKADAGRPPSRDTWLAREIEVRSRLTVEQAAKLHQIAAAQSQTTWNYLGRSLGSMIGASREEQAKFQQTLGDWRPPTSMLLPEGHGADWPGMLREGSTRLQPVLSSDQIAKINRLVQR